jgi:predicted amidohydrolase YtcJ
MMQSWVAGPEQRAVTIEASYPWRQEDRIGSLAPGKIVNFTMLEDAPTAVNPMTLKDIPIWGTVFSDALYSAPRG